MTIRKNISNYYSEDFLTQVSAGLIPGHSLVHKYGRSSTSAMVERAVTSDGAITFLSAPTTVRIKAGGNANDTAAGTGCQLVTVEGSDGNGLFISETIPTNGSSASSATTQSFFRVYRVYDTDQGTYLTDGLGTNGSNQGNIVIENSAGGTDIITLSQYEGQTQYAAYHVPADKTAFLYGVTAQVDSSKTADVSLYFRRDATNTTPPVKARRLKSYFDGVQGEFVFDTRLPIKISSDTDMWFTYTPSANGTECSVDFELLLIDNDRVNV